MKFVFMSIASAVIWLGVDCDSLAHGNCKRYIDKVMEFLDRNREFDTRIKFNQLEHLYTTESDSCFLYFKADKLRSRYLDLCEKVGGRLAWLPTYKLASSLLVNMQSKTERKSKVIHTGLRKSLDYLGDTEEISRLGWFWESSGNKSGQIKFQYTNHWGTLPSKAFKKYNLKGFEFDDYAFSPSAKLLDVGINRRTVLHVIPVDIVGLITTDIILIKTVRKYEPRCCSALCEFVYKGKPAPYSNWTIPGFSPSPMKIPTVPPIDPCYEENAGFIAGIIVLVILHFTLCLGICGQIRQGKDLGR